MCLLEAGEDAAHAGAAWRREIMRLNLLITGNAIWAGRSKAMRMDVGGGGGETGCSYERR